MPKPVASGSLPEKITISACSSTSSRPRPETARPARCGTPRRALRPSNSLPSCRDCAPAGSIIHIPVARASCRTDNVPRSAATACSRSGHGRRPEPAPIPSSHTCLGYGAKLADDDVERLVPADARIAADAARPRMRIVGTPVVSQQQIFRALRQVHPLFPGIGQRHLHFFSRAREDAARCLDLVEPDVVGNVERKRPDDLATRDVANGRKVRPGQTGGGVRDVNYFELLTIRLANLGLPKSRTGSPVGST